MAFEELKARQSAMWGSGPFERIEALIADMHELVAERASPRPGERLLDIGSGTGAVAFRAARAGADVTGVDLAPTLVETARRLAEEEGLEVRLDVGDAERLPYGDGAFDVVTSSVGAMFAPDHEAVARELARVTRPDGRLVFTAWRPDGGIGDVFRLMAPFQPPPPPGAGNPFEWGREEYTESLLGDAFELRFEEHDSPYTPESGEEAWEVFSTAYGPTKTLADSLEPERREELHRAFVEFHEQYRGEAGIRQSRTYLLALGTRR